MQFSRATVRGNFMKTLTMYQVDAFSDQVFGGNPAAVLVLEAWLPENVMQNIASENNLAETAFVRPNGAAWDLRWFTPAREVNFCGHATLATAHVLAFERGVIGEMAFNTRVGELRVARDSLGYRLDLPSFPPEPWGDSPSINGIFAEQPMSIFRNFENLFVELAGEQAVRDFVPDFLKIGQLHALGLVVTGKGDAYDFVSRYFAPAAGVPEDPVTGSIHATLVPYWAKRLGKSKLSAYQCSRRGGRLTCELSGDRVLITGQAVTFMKADIYLPT